MLQVVMMVGYHAGHILESARFGAREFLQQQCGGDIATANDVSVIIQEFPGNLGRVGQSCHLHKFAIGSLQFRDTIRRPRRKIWG